jgi:hypothetical protein
MKKLLLILAGLWLSLSLFGQEARAIKPTLMVMPSQAWCNTNGYMEEYDNQGTKVLTPNYKRALQTNQELNMVISMINGLMTERGFPLVDLSSAIDGMERELAQNRVITSGSGAMAVEDPIDILKRQARADITMELDYFVTKTGPRQTVTYTLRGLDAYTNKQVAGGPSNTGAPSSAADVPTLLREAILVNIDHFNDQLQRHFDDLFANGREVTVRVQVFENTKNIDLYTEFGDKELNEIIDEWMYQNTVRHRYSKQGASRNFISFDQVRIPLFDERGRPMDTEAFVQNLRRHLRAEPFSIPAMVDMRGLGQAVLFIGDR